MKKILYITESNLKTKYPNGGELVSINNLNLLRQLPSYDIITIDLYSPPKLIRKIKKILFGILGFYYPVNKKLIKKLEETIIKNKIEYVYIDNSRLGLLSYYIKKTFNHKVKVITYFHNDEVNYFKEKKNNSFLQRIIFRSIKKSQIYALKESNSCLFISEVEMNRLSMNKKNDHVIPIYIEDQFDNDLNPSNDSDDYLLFLGSLFPPNIEAVKWLKNNIMPYVPYKLLIIGKNFEIMKDELESDNIIVIGTVEKTSDYIKNANIILSPIFSGAGLKVKIAESLMYGKRIIATDFSLTGYNKQEISNFILISNDDKSFIKNINKNFTTSKKYYPEVRDYFINNYSKRNTLEKLGDILEKI